MENSSLLNSYKIFLKRGVESIRFMKFRFIKIFFFANIIQTTVSNLESSWVFGFFF